jgi:hypothetical protein
MSTANATRVIGDDLVAIPDHLRTVITNAADWTLIRVCEEVQTDPTEYLFSFVDAMRDPAALAASREQFRAQRDELRAALDLIDRLDDGAAKLPGDLLAELARTAARDMDCDIRYEVERGVDHEKLATMVTIARELWKLAAAAPAAA